jgi:hypothetical protein
LRIKGKWQPVPSKLDDTTGVKPDQADEPPPELISRIVGQSRPRRIVGSGPSAQVFQQLWDRCQEHRVTALRRLELSFSGFNKSDADSLAAIGLAIPQLGKAAFGITLQLDIQFDPPPGQQFTLSFQGTWERYKRFKQISDSFAREDVHSRKIDFTLIVDFGRDVPLGDGQLKDAQAVLTQMNMGPIHLSAVSVYRDQ